jgi:hypothetical protein
MGDMFSKFNEQVHTFVSRIACSSSLTHLVVDASERGDSSANAVRIAVDTSGCLGLEGCRWSGKGNASAISSAVDWWSGVKLRTLWYILNSDSTLLQMVSSSCSDIRVSTDEM